METITFATDKVVVNAAKWWFKKICFHSHEVMKFAVIKVATTTDEYHYYYYYHAAENLCCRTNMITTGEN